MVSAESKKTGAATASKISKSAMEHIQATSLADIMSLLPGASTRTAEEIALKKVSTFSVRNGQSFGTAIIMDGAPLRTTPTCRPCRWRWEPAQGPAYRPPTRASTCEPSPPTTSNR
ncbi:MAG: TonB-dependent receptor plug domain-containing protein [Alistipes shahii]